MVLLMIIPIFYGYFIGNIPYFQTNPDGCNSRKTADETSAVNFRCNQKNHLMSPKMSYRKRCAHLSFRAKGTIWNHVENHRQDAIVSVSLGKS